MGAFNMSFISNDYINSIERGYGDSDKKLCHECIGNKSLKEYIKANGYVCTCDYCGQRRKAVNLDSFMVTIMSGVNFLYTHAVNELPCDSGEYIGKTYTTAQLIFEELRDEIDAQDERILKDIVEIMYDDIWCDADPFSDREEDVAYYDWQSFCKMVKEKVEYVPTQIVTEFFRYVKTSRSNGYAGILYESTQNPGGKCLALFLTRDEVLNHKYGIHIIPKATTYHKKEYVTVDNNSTLIAKGKIHIDSLANEKVSELVKKQKIPKETIESIVKRTEQK